MPSIDRIDIVGNRQVQTVTLPTLICSRSGDPFSSEVVQRDVNALLESGLFIEVLLKVEGSPTQPNAKIVESYVEEKPRSL